MGHHISKRTRLTQAARRLIHASGYTQTSLADIARAAEVPLGNVYYYFRTKQLLAEAVIAEQAQEFQQLTQELDRLGEPRARIDGFLSMLVLEREKFAAHGCPVGGLCSELNKSEPELAKQANALLQAMLAWLTGQFSAMDKGEEAAELALQLLSQLQGATLLTQILHEPDLFTRQVAHAKAWLDALT